MERVFALCADFGNLPRIFPAVEEVIDYGDGRSHWIATTPAGSLIAFDAVITKFLTNSVIGWRSVPVARQCDMTGIDPLCSPRTGRHLHFHVTYRLLRAASSHAARMPSLSLLTRRRASRRRNRVMHELAERLAEAIPERDLELPPVLSPESESPESVKIG